MPNQGSSLGNSGGGREGIHYNGLDIRGGSARKAYLFQAGGI